MPFLSFFRHPVRSALLCLVLSASMMSAPASLGEPSAVATPDAASRGASREASDTTTAAASGPSSDDGFLRQYAETFRFRLGHPSSIEMTPSGDAVLFLRSGGRSFVRDLYLFDPTTGEERKLLTAEQILDGTEEVLTDEEKARRERMRLAARGIAGYSLSADGEWILAPLSGRLFLVAWRSGDVVELPVEGGFAIDPQFSPDGTKVLYVAEGDLYVVDLATAGMDSDLSDGSSSSGSSAPSGSAATVRRLTDTSTDTVTNGLAEFVAQEEMGRDHGYWVSPDGEWLLYAQVDVDGLEMFSIPDPADPGKTPQSWPYPRPGKKNATVRLGVIPTAGGETTWFDWDDEAYPYLATVRWAEGAAPVALVQNRYQTEEVLLRLEPSTGATSELLTERDSAWLNLDQDFPAFLPDGRFLWSSEADGAWRVELRAADGDLERVVVPKSFGFGKFVQLDAEGDRLYVTGGDDPTSQDLWAFPLSGRGEPRRLTTFDGMVMPTMSADGSRYLLQKAVVDEVTPTYELYELDGTRLGSLTTEAEAPAFAVEPEFVTVGEEPSLHAVVLRPSDFDSSRRYPVILQVYGGPHAQMVSRSAGRYVLGQWLANQGYIVVSIDGRGTPRRGRDWERSIKHDFINQPLEDQVRGLQALGERFAEMDMERVGVFGWSFGGYFSAMATMRRPDIFDAGVAGAPVTDWLDYDTHYTERYIGLPEEQPEAYERSNVLTYADQLEKPLLIIHGTADDNVYFVHGLKMSDALMRAGKPHEFLPLSGHTHMVTEPAVVEAMYRRIVGFFHDHLGELSAR